MTAAGLLLVVPSLRLALLVQRSRQVSEPLTWACPGGHLEAGETPREAARREFAEETGVKPIGRALGYVDTRAGSSTYRLFVAAVTATEAARVWRSLRLNWESADAVWASLDKPPMPLHPGVAAAWPTVLQLVADDGA